MMGFCENGIASPCSISIIVFDYLVNCEPLLMCHNLFLFKNIVYMMLFLSFYNMYILKWKHSTFEQI